MMYLQSQVPDTDLSYHTWYCRYFCLFGTMQTYFLVFFNVHFYRSNEHRNNMNKRFSRTENKKYACLLQCKTPCLNPPPPLRGLAGHMICLYQILFSQSFLFCKIDFFILLNTAKRWRKDRAVFLDIDPYFLHTCCMSPCQAVNRFFSPPFYSPAISDLPERPNNVKHSVMVLQRLREHVCKQSQSISKRRRQLPTFDVFPRCSVRQLLQSSTPHYTNHSIHFPEHATGAHGPALGMAKRA